MTNSKMAKLLQRLNTELQGLGRQIILAILIVSVVLGAAYLALARRRYHNIAVNEAFRLANTAQIFLYEKQYMDISLSEISSDYDEYVSTALGYFVNNTDDIFFAAVISTAGAEIKAIQVPHQLDFDFTNTMKNVYADLVAEKEQELQSGENVITPPLTDEQGTWMHCFVPILDPAKGSVTSIFAMTFSAYVWETSILKHLAIDLVTVISFLILILLLMVLRQQRQNLLKESKKLTLQETLYRSVFEQAPIGIALISYDDNAVAGEFGGINKIGEDILGRSNQDLLGLPWSEFTHPLDLNIERVKYNEFLASKSDSYSIEKRMFRPDDSLVWVNLKVARFAKEESLESLYLCLFEDITQRKEIEQALQESERSKSVFLSHIPGMGYRCYPDKNWTMQYVSVGVGELTGYQAHELINNALLSYNDIILPEYRQAIRHDWNRTLARGQDFRSEYEIKTKSGERKWVLELGQGVFDEQGNVEAIEGIVFDISEEKQKEFEITYLQRHDYLTGLFHRKHLNKMVKEIDLPDNLPLAVVLCDIDGLRMINDAYGPAEGDRIIIETANLLNSNKRKSDVLGRVSGGEFMLLAPKTNQMQAKKFIDRIENILNTHSRSGKAGVDKINITFAFDAKTELEENIEDVISSAQDFLRNRKLLKQNSTHSAIISSIMATLYAKSQETEEHGQRMGQYCQLIGEKLGLHHKDLDDMELFSKLHDIGKIGIEDAILNKPDKLTEEEWIIMRQHPKIGYDIAKASPQLDHIANYIFTHHEHWDGSGYPSGLKGEQIPLHARILAVADAFDAMTEDRVYRKALSFDVALQELQKYAGTQFDPQIVEIFVTIMQEGAIK